MADRKPTVEELLAVGKACVLEFESNGAQQQRYRTFIRGWQVGAYVLLEIPQERYQGGLLREGQPCSIRFLSDGSACAVSAALLDLGGGGMFNYIRTGWPTRVATAQLREHKRAQLHVPCRIDAPRGQRFDGGQVQDLSAGGCQVRLVRRAEVGQELFLSFTLPDGTRVHQLPAVVRNAQMTGKACRAGCQFQFDDADLRASIELYVATTLERLEYAGKRKPEVLVIGQTPEEAGSLIEPLCNRGFQVRWAAGAVDGIFRMRMTMPDVVVMSYDQPELRGPGLCLVIKRNERFKSLPVVVYGDGDGSAGRAARDAGAAAYVPSLEDPLNVVRAVAPYAAECMG